MADETHETLSAAGGRFTTTHWSAVVRAGHADAAQAEGALSELCRTYWYPLYAFARRQGCPPAEAEDLTQGFFSRLFEKRVHCQRGPGEGPVPHLPADLVQAFPGE
jgi:RNA polymerase sigma-70 factor (ECF subfamily)